MYLYIYSKPLLANLTHNNKKINKHIHTASCHLGIMHIHFPLTELKAVFEQITLKHIRRYTATDRTVIDYYWSMSVREAELSVCSCWFYVRLLDFSLWQK